MAATRTSRLHIMSTNSLVAICESVGSDIKIGRCVRQRVTWLIPNAKVVDMANASTQPMTRDTRLVIAVLFAEWGDLTQILTANLAARYHSAFSVGVGATLALWAVAGIAVASGQTLVRFINVATIRKITACVLLALAAYSVLQIFRS